MKTAVEYLAYAWAVQGAIYQDDIDKAIEMEKHQRQEDTNYGYSQGWDDGNENKEPMRPELKQQDNEDSN
jgi:hypothetical protein